MCTDIGLVSLRNSFFALSVFRKRVCLCLTEDCVGQLASHLPSPFTPKSVSTIPLCLGACKLKSTVLTLRKSRPAAHIAPDSEERKQASLVFAFVGGVALLTLVVNGLTAGPLLKKLGLVTPTETRKRVRKGLGLLAIVVVYK